ncbi:hypothetical protein GALMADRAFT_279302 [Galerina marginata CBS 339.88]|uniref:NmrA-like domain-containing protein n=1 Tax=Galerina marginata (strain CBS 339.88) TaxID=685588 RepID=A0A067TAL6_GALM3|nr:hypothetical protein GALMADRAFT_279302 [Galerina marginata CBS 339.88]
MSFSVLLLGATGTIGSQIALKLAKYQDQLKRVAFLTSSADGQPEKEAKYKTVPIPRVVGSFEDPASYHGFDIVISAVGDTLCEAQIKYIDAAFEGGAKHFYPAEYGMDLSKELASTESYFVNKLKVRKHLEDKVSKDASKGYTYIMVGMFSDFMLQYNILFLSDDKKSASFLGDPEAKLSTTQSDDVGSIVALSLLPSHLKSLSDRRQIRFAGSTLSIAEYFSTVASVLGHDIKVQYLSKDSSYIFEQEQKALGNEFMYKFTSARRALGFGGAAFDGVDNGSYLELKPTTWEEAVKAALA